MVRPVQAPKLPIPMTALRGSRDAGRDPPPDDGFQGESVCWIAETYGYLRKSLKEKQAV